MYIDIKSQNLREILREELKQLLEELKKTEKKVLPPLSIGQLAEHYDVSKATVHNWINRGLVTGFKMGKGRFFHLEEVEKSLTRYNHSDALEKKLS
jgi:transposase